jgi:isopenicillin N synthase-like dioxygenase
VINHGLPESLMKAMTDACGDFFNLTEEEKREYGGKHVLDSIRCGTSVNASVDKVLFWRDFLKFFVHPQFHSPSKPAGFRYIWIGLQLISGIFYNLQESLTTYNLYYSNLVKKR